LYGSWASTTILYSANILTRTKVSMPFFCNLSPIGSVYNFNSCGKTTNHIRVAAGAASVYAGFGSALNYTVCMLCAESIKLEDRGDIFRVHQTLCFAWHTVPLQRFCYVVYNSHLFNGFNNCSFWSIIIVITLGARTERRQANWSATHVLASWKVKILYDNTIFTVELQ
jgi:hypothetical protein